MYVPPQFREERRDVLIAAMRGIGLAGLVTAGEDGLRVSHVPAVVKEAGDGALVLETHVARQNDHWRAAATPVASVAIFQGPQAYVSPSWYATKREHGRVVPTWNYVAVHAHGLLEAVEDVGWLRGHLDDLTAANETGREAPWAVSDAPEAFIRNLAGAIVGLRLTIERIDGAWKLIQHRPEGDRHGAIAGLETTGDPGARAVAAAMRAADVARG